MESYDIRPEVTAERDDRIRLANIYLYDENEKKVMLATLAGLSVSEIAQYTDLEDTVVEETIDRANKRIDYAVAQKEFKQHYETFNPSRVRIVGSVATDLSWRDRAACRGEDPELFFPKGTTTREDVQQTENAKKICKTCPVKNECNEYAFSHAEPAGIWGGITEKERSVLLKKNTRQRRSR